MKSVRLAALAGAVVLAGALPASALPKFTSHYAQNGAVKIHYSAAGAKTKPLVVMIHGYPGFWYDWRNLMDELDGEYRTVAMDTRGYNLSDKPVGVENYKHEHLIKDVEAVIKAEGRTSAIIVGHDWGASISWNVVLQRPDLVDRLVIMSVPHPSNMQRELKINPQQVTNSNYARRFQQPGSENSMTAESTASWVTDPEAKKVYIEAFRRSSFASMMNYYRANYPTASGDAVVVETYPKINVSTLVIHGMKDTALLSPGHNGTWDHVSKDTTVMMLPDATHWIERDAGPLVNRTIRDWLNARPVKVADQK